MNISFEEYLIFLDEYWELFGPIPPPKPKVHYNLILI